MRRYALSVRAWIRSPSPAEYPAEPDHLPLEGEVLDADAAREDAAREDAALSLDLPERIGTFQQGALVLQWEALPFYYEHRLLLVAQTDSTVSAVNRVTQRDFEYVTPAVAASGSYGVSEPAGADRTEYVCLQISLGRYWDSLPKAGSKALATGEAAGAYDGGFRADGCRGRTL